MKKLFYCQSNCPNIYNKPQWPTLLPIISIENQQMLHSCQNPNISCCVSKTYLLCTQASKNTTNGVFTDPCQPHVTCGPRPFINTISSPLLLYFRGKSILGKRISLRILFIWLMIFCFCDRNILYPMFFLIYRQSTATFSPDP